MRPLSATPDTPSPPALTSMSSVATPSASPIVTEESGPRILTRREEAFTLYCQGYRSPAISGLLGIPERTIRSWIAATLQASADDSRTRRDQQLRLAIESQRAIVKAAWQAYDRATRAERLTLEHLQNAIPLNVDEDLNTNLADGPLFDSPSPRGRGGRAARSPIPHLPIVGARYLQIVLHAQREIARLSGLYHLPDSFYDPDAGRPMQIVITRHPNLPPDQMLAWAAFRAQWDAAHPEHPVPSDELVFPPDGAPHHDYGDPDDPDDPAATTRGVTSDNSAVSDRDEHSVHGKSGTNANETPSDVLPRHASAPAPTEMPADRTDGVGPSTAYPSPDFGQSTQYADALVRQPPQVETPARTADTAIGSTPTPTLPQPCAVEAPPPDTDDAISAINSSALQSHPLYHPPDSSSPLFVPKRGSTP